MLARNSNSQKDCYIGTDPPKRNISLVNFVSQPRKVFVFTLLVSNTTSELLLFVDYFVKYFP